MKNFKTTKKLLSLVLCVLMVFSTVSIASAETQDDAPAGTLTDCQNGNHVFGGYVGEVIEATCEKEGLETYRCSVCNETYEMITPKTGHRYDDEAWVTIVEAQHTNLAIIQGRRRNYCLDCNEMQLEYVNIPHKFAEDDAGEIMKYPTCVSVGGTLKKCLLCEKNQPVEIPVDENAHVYDGVYFTGKAPTCTTPGSGVKVCIYCDHIENVTNVYAKNEDEAHSYLPWTIAEPNLPDDAVCSGNQVARLIKFCPDCNKIVDEQEFSAKHEIINPVGVVATCSDYGYAKGFCNKCGTSGVTNILFPDSSKHVWMEDIVVEEATCQNDGRILRRCKLNRAHAEYVTVKDGAHKLADEWTVTKEATCNKPGTKTNTCSVCNVTFTEEIPADESLHIFDEENSTKELDNTLSCKILVKEKSKCKVCNKDMEREILNHDFVLLGEVDPTCGETGKIFYKCSKCSEDKIVIIPVDHTKHIGSGYYYVTTDPTCTTDGVESELCMKCKKAIPTSTKTVPKTGHNASEWEWKIVGGEVLKSTCDSSGAQVRKCTNKGCSFSITMNINPSHSYTAWAYSGGGKDSATCKTPVTRTRKCLVETCKHIDQEEYYGSHIPGSFRFLSGNCTTGGTVEAVCGCCDKVYKVFDVRAGEHILDTENSKDLECDPAVYCGGKIYTCHICKSKVELSIRHSYRHIDTEIGAFDATCTMPGLTGKKQCIDCFYVLEQQIILPTGHNYVWGSKGEEYCSRCGDFKVGEEVNPETGETEDVNCRHFCHNKGTFAKILLKVLTIFWKMFGINQECDCGAVHYETKK